MERKLDRSRHFTTVFGGIPEHGGLYGQDGCYFKPDGSLAYAPDSISGGDVVMAPATIVDEPVQEDKPAKKARAKKVELTDENHDLL